MTEVVAPAAEVVVAAAEVEIVPGTTGVVEVAVEAEPEMIEVVVAAAYFHFLSVMVPVTAAVCFHFRVAIEDGGKTPLSRCSSRS